MSNIKVFLYMIIKLFANLLKKLYFQSLSCIQSFKIPLLHPPNDSEIHSSVVILCKAQNKGPDQILNERYYETKKRKKNHGIILVKS